MIRINVMFKNLSNLFSLRLIKRRFSIFDATKQSRVMDDQKIPDIPIIVILGETGVGKTKLAVELCRRFNGEVISADSMQIYEGLDIITNKVTPDEAQGVPHHLIGIVSPSSSSNFNVQAFKHRAVRIMKDIWTKRRTVPVIVGGTNYYIEALLWNRLVAGDEENSDAETAEKESFLKSIPFDVEAMTDEQLHEELRRIDPVAAERKHPKNRRRVVRSLQIYYETGRLHSEWLKDQHSTNGGNLLGGPLLYSRLCVFWLTCTDRTVLSDRLRRRVDEMVEKGLQDEITTFYDQFFEDYSKRYGSDATTKGILQSIGLKEFEDYLRLPPDRRSSDVGTKAFNDGVEKLKIVTIRYAKKQKQWITNRFCRLAARDSIPIYRLDATDVSRWHENVSDLAEHVVEAFLAGRQPDKAVETVSASLENYSNEWSVENRYCDDCERLISGLQWAEHTKSFGHRWKVISKAKVPVVVINREPRRRPVKSSDDSDPVESISKIIP